MPELFNDPTAIITTIERWQQRQSQIQATADSITPRQAVDMSRLSRMFPFVSPGVIRGLGQMGAGPDDAVTQFAITQEMLRNFSTRGDWSGQVGKIQRQAQHGTKSEPVAMSTSEKLKAHFFEPSTSPANQSLKFERAQDLLKKGENEGVFDPNTQILVEPDFDDPSYKTFTNLQDIIFDLSQDAVPYLAKDGKIRGYRPSESYVGDPELDVTTGEPLLPEDQPDPTILGAYRNPSGIGGSLGYREDYGASERKAITSDIISQIFQASEANPNTAKTRENAIIQASQAGIDPRGVIGGITPAVRSTFMAFDAPIQEAQGQVRNIYGALHGEDVDWLQSQSDLGIVIGQIAKGQAVDVGSGFFVDPESAVARERYTREAERGKIGDHNITIGRILANTVTEPDTKPFQIISGLTDASAQIWADPTTYALGGAANISDARKSFTLEENALESAGIFKGVRAQFHGPTFQAWANKNTPLINFLSESTSAYDIAKKTNFKLEPDLTNLLANESDPTQIRNILDMSVNQGRILTTTQLNGTRLQRYHNNWDEFWRATTPSYNPRTIRATKMMPNQTLDLESPNQVAVNLVRSLQNAHAHEDDIRAVYNMVASAEGKNGLRAAVMESQARVGGLLDSYGIKDPEIRSFLTRVNVETYNEDLRGFTEEIGADTPPWEHMNMNGDIVKVPGAHLPLEHIGRYIHLPDQREVRRLTSKFNFLTAKGTDIPVLTPLKIKAGIEEAANTKDIIGLPRLPVAAADYLMSEYLKPMWLMRLAWPVRVIGEEQLRMAGAGLDSVVKHPISYLATVIGGDQNRMVRMLDKMTPGIGAKMQVSPNGALWEETEHLKNVTYRAHAGWLGHEAVVRTNLPTVYTKHSIHELADYRTSWAHELALLHHDPVSNFLANHNLDETIQWLYRGAGNKYRRELMEAHPGNLENYRQVEEYVKTVSNRISYATSGHPDLIDVVKSGKFSKFKNGEEVVSDVFHDAPRLNPQFSQHLKGYEDVGPDKIKGFVAIAQKDRGNFTKQWDQVMDRMFSVLMGTPTSTLSRAPAFKQYVWKRAAELLPYADNEARDIILANAEKARLNSRQMKNLRRAASQGKKDADGIFVGALNADDVDLLAKGYAVQDTKTLLYDLSERSQIFDIMRILVPFGEAWKEVLTRWAKLATIQGPMGIPLPGKAVRRFQQTIQGARGTGLGNFLGSGVDPLTGKDRGFFYTNEFGEEVYTYPGSEWVTSALTGVPVPLTGRVQGLNMFGNILPGLGPVAQIPAAWFLQDKPQHDWWREQLLPFGAPGSQETEDIFSLREYLPAWGKTILDWVADGGDDRIYNSSIMYTATYLYSTGKYGDTADEQQRLLEDAKDAARDLYKVRGLGQFMLPASPSFEWQTKSKDGELFNTRILAEEFYALQQDDYDTAVGKFLDMYGPYAIGAIVPHSRNVISAVPTSVEGAAWIAKHKSIKTKYPLVYGFFAPEGEFNMNIYTRNYLTGEREAITPREWLNLRDTLIGNYHYYRAKDMLGVEGESPNREQAAWLRTQRANILEMYPNWNNNVGLSERPTNDQMVAQLYEASKNRTVKGTNAGKGLIEYLRYREQAQAQAVELGHTSFGEANDLAPTRQWLTDHAYAIIKKYPEFEKLWDVVFSREMEDAVVEPKG